MLSAPRMVHFQLNMTYIAGLNVRNTNRVERCSGGLEDSESSGLTGMLLYTWGGTRKKCTGQPPELEQEQEQGADICSWLDEE